VCWNVNIAACTAQSKTEERYYSFREEELLNLNDDDRG